MGPACAVGGVLADRMANENHERRAELVFALRNLRTNQLAKNNNKPSQFCQ